MAVPMCFLMDQRQFSLILANFLYWFAVSKHIGESKRTLSDVNVVQPDRSGGSSNECKTTFCVA